MANWMVRPTERWKWRNSPLACPQCDHDASETTFRRGRYMLQDETLTCDRPDCRAANLVRSWRARGRTNKDREDLQEDLRRATEILNQE